MNIEVNENMHSGSGGRWEFIDEYSFVELPPGNVLKLDIDTGSNGALKAVKGRVENSVEIATLLKCSNVVAVNRLGYSDHGPGHIEIVAGLSLKLLKMLKGSGVCPSCMMDYGLTYDDAEVIVFLGACLHDIGHSIHRDNHSQYGVWMSMPILAKVLEGIYPPEVIPLITSEVLHCIAVHHKDCRPLTIEAGVLRVCDALDMAHGRTRLWDDMRRNSIHSISARAIDSVEMVEGSSKPILIKVRMTGSAGIFQVDELLRPKLQGSGIQDYVQVEAEISGEKKVIEGFTLD